MPAATPPRPGTTPRTRTTRDFWDTAACLIDPLADGSPPPPEPVGVVPKRARPWSGAGPRVPIVPLRPMPLIVGPETPLEPLARIPTILLLPPCSPELNPVENLWH
jgi:hypothetical protein